MVLLTGAMVLEMQLFQMSDALKRCASELLKSNVSSGLFLAKYNEEYKIMMKFVLKMKFNNLDQTEIY